MRSLFCTLNQIQKANKYKNNDEKNNTNYESNKLATNTETLNCERKEVHRE